MDTILDVCNRYFGFVVEDGHFVVCIDYIGVYLFYVENNDWAEEAQGIIDDLDADKFEVIYCGKGKPVMGVSMSVSLNELNDWCSELVDDTPAVYMRADICEMVACYKGYSDVTANFLAEYGVSDEIFREIISREGWTTQQLQRLGLDITVARQVEEVMRIREKHDDYEFTAMSRALGAFARKKVLAAMLCDGLAIIVLMIFWQGYLSMILGMVGLFFSFVGHRADDSWLTSVSIFVSLLVMMCAFVLCYGQTAVDVIVSFLQSRDF